MKKIHKCKCHRLQYTVCPACGCQYCAVYWSSGCPRTSWHPNHATTDEDRGKRLRELEEGRGRRIIVQRGL